MSLIINDTGKGNTVTGKPTGRGRLEIIITGNNNCVEIGQNVEIRGHSRIFMHNSAQYCKFSGDNIFRGDVIFKRKRGSFLFGKGASTNASIWANIGEEGDKISIGEGCLLAGVRFRTSDSHKIIDRATGQRLNPSGSIIIERGVWLAEDVLCLRGAHVGEGSIVGTRSLVNSVLPPFSLCVGTPARVVRENVSWEA
jgi:acetyltransferase-like isoleucine patch superfamily enzyme